MLYRPLITLTVASTVMVCILCVLLAVAATRSHERLQVLRSQLDLLGRLEESARSAVSASLTDQRERLEIALADLARNRDELDEATALDLGATFRGEPGDLIPWAARRRAALDELMRDARAEWWLMLILAALLGAGSLVLALQLRRHVLQPLEVLNGLLNAMSMRHHVVVDTTGTNPALRPLFESYNDLVERVSSAQEIQLRREAELRQELREATRTLMQQHAAMMRDQRLAATGEFTAQIAHDMRNPLAGILAAVENLRRDSSDEDRRERLQMVGDEVKRLARQLDDLVDASRQRPEPATRIDLCEVVESVLSLASYQLPPNLALGCDIDPGLRLNVPEGNFRQALLNLIINASHAVGEEAPGTIDVRAERGDEHVVLSVRDSGPGFSDEALETGVRAFATFSVGGTGLGLAAVRRFINDLGGKLVLENPSDGGGRVTLLFPVALSDG